MGYEILTEEKHKLAKKKASECFDVLVPSISTGPKPSVGDQTTVVLFYGNPGGIIRISLQMSSETEEYIRNKETRSVNRGQIFT